VRRAKILATIMRDHRTSPDVAVAGRRDGPGRTRAPSEATIMRDLRTLRIVAIARRPRASIEAGPRCRTKRSIRIVTIARRPGVSMEAGPRCRTKRGMRIVAIAGGCTGAGRVRSGGSTLSPGRRSRRRGAPVCWSTCRGARSRRGRGCAPGLAAKACVASLHHRVTYNQGRGTAGDPSNRGGRVLLRPDSAIL
jgi:hypothetical protein